MSAPQVTVVVPVYNVAAYLDEAVGSVLAQTNTDWELILVDDGATDASGAMCDAWISRDVRIRVIHKENGGLASARNAGLDMARGEWVLFLDGDDKLAPEALQTALAHSEGADVVAFGLARFPESGTGWLDKAYSFGDVREMGGYMEQIWRDGVLSACTKLYRRASICCRFDESLRHAEDLIFNLEYLPHAQGIRFISESLYHYRWNGRENTLGKRFWLDQPEISARAWGLTRRVFAGVPAALTFFDKRYVYEICKHLKKLAQIEAMPERQRLLVMQMYLQEPLLRERCFAETPKTPDDTCLWRLVARGDAAAVCEFLRTAGDGVPGFVWTE
ncbi:MAG: glycosyltransferase family 2 protein [Clostridia bacterium]|nr:glycosyltransferase family 2 protein [Clostridia bacterium]